MKIWGNLVLGLFSLILMLFAGHTTLTLDGKLIIERPGAVLFLLVLTVLICLLPSDETYP